ncbi:hypothetical protein Cch01nite_30870 [Cellulomonas chitinilytica]|uniref:DUF11 domain-containing protein n=1 Tax=Cellulomonas chitinilytica TaxID=398759 RepID=A0A919P5K1_9CELL|nr:hypothetical protein Cch01nite_30870 [Cellulomonas chitinilytica]
MRRTAVAAALVLVGIVLGPVQAAMAVPGIELSKSAPGQALAGEPITFTLTLTNPDTNPDAVPEFNASFRDTLPPGLTYVPGSTTPSGAGDPVIVTDPVTGAQTLTWANVADMEVGGSVTLTFQAQPDPAVYPVGSVVPNTADGYASTDPFVAPQFDADGALVPGTATETSSDSSTTTTISALEVTKSEPSPEGELLRGVHDETTVYTLTVRGSDAGPTTGLVLTDHLPAQLEFLGCGGVDSSSAPEYPGAPSLAATPAVADCPTPVSVTTVVNPPPDGTTTYPAGTYTRVQWAVPDLPAGGTFTVRYAAGVPLFANAAWPAGTDPAGLGQVANLDNNTGPSTRETTTEQAATNTARVTGTYGGPLAPGADPATADDTTHTVQVEDVRMRKAVSPTVFTAGRIATYTVTVDSSEYVSADDVVLHDVVPDGLCPLGAPGTNYESGGIAECDGVAPGPSTPYASVAEHADGTFDLTFAPLALGIDDTAVVTYQARMLSTYLGGPLGGDPTAVGDAFTNHVDLTATTTPDPATGQTGTEQVLDDSSATLSSSGALVDKLVAPRSLSGGTCPTSLADYGEPGDPGLPAAETSYREGDLACFALRVDFSDETQTRNPVVADFLPPAMEYVDGSAVEADEASGAPFTVQATPSTVIFDIGTVVGDARFAAAGAVFAVVLQARVVESAPGTTAEVQPNLLKGTGDNSAGQSQAFRDELDVLIGPIAPLSLVKGVESVDQPPNGPNGVNSDVDGVDVRLGSTATFRIDVTHDGTPGAADGYAVDGVDVWDVLPPQVRCAQVSDVVPDPRIPVPAVVTCTDPGDAGHPTFAGGSTHSLLRVDYVVDQGGDLAAQSTLPGQTLTTLYDLTIPPPARVGTVYDNTAYVHSYQATTNVDATPTTFYPQDNIDADVPAADQTAPAASDPSDVVVPSPVADKSVATGIDETNNDAPSQATLGEELAYRYGVTIPASTSVYDGSLTDRLPAGIVQDGPATLLFHPDAGNSATAPVPAGITIDTSTGTVTFPELYTNGTTVDQRFEVVLPVRVTTAALQPTQNALDATNTARFDSLESPGGSALAPATASATVNLRQPQPLLAKTNDQSTPVPGGTLVTYTLTARNANTDGSATNRPPLHDTFLVDCVPEGMTFDAYGADPGRAPAPGGAANGCPTGTTALVWALDTLAPGATVARTYTAFLPPDAVGGTAYTNTATLSGSTLDDGKAGPTDEDNPLERSMSATASSTVRIVGAEMQKSVTPDRATIGEEVTWTISYVHPPNTVFYDGSVIDQLPAGIEGAEITSVSCEILTTPTTPCTLNATPLADAPGPGGSTLVGWTFGDEPALDDPRLITVTFRSTIADIGSNVAGAGVTNTVVAKWNVTPDGPNDAPTSAGDEFDLTGPSGSATVTVLEPNLTIDKTVDDVTPGPTDRFRYTLTVTNAMSPTASAAYDGVVTDAVPTGVVVDPTSITFGGELTGADPVTGGGLITWDATDLSNALPPGASIVLSYEAVLAPSSGLTSAPLTNTATVESYRSLDDAGRVYAGPDDQAVVNPAFPHLETTKTALSPSPAYIGEPFRWQVSVTNTGGAPAFGIDVVDTLPPGWTYVPGSTLITGPRGGTARIDPVTLLGRLTWSDLGTLQPGQSATVAFDAVPGDSVVTNPGVGSGVAHVNTGQTFGEDATQATGNADGSYAGPPSTAQTFVDSADVRIAKTHTDPVVAGSTATWSVVVTNDGGDPAVGPWTVTDTLPTGVGLVSAGGTGWACTSTTTTVTCARTTAAETLASGASFPPITVVTSVPATTPSGTVLTNAVTVGDRTFDPDLANNTTTDDATVTASADLAVSKAHAGRLVAGQRAVWTVGVVNNGPSDSIAPLTLTDTLPAGTTFVSALGIGWSCSATGQVVTCTRGTTLAAGASAPQIVLTADIASDVTGTLTNTAVVAGTTPDPVPGNNTAVDPGPVVTIADLAIQKSHVGDFLAGTVGTYHLVVTNFGPSDAAAPVEITDTLPTGLSYVSSTDVTGTWTCGAAGQVVTCTLAGGLAVDDTVEVAIDVLVDPDLGTGEFTNTATVDSATDDPNLANNTDTDDTAFDSEADLLVEKTHTGVAVAGEQLTWTLQVSNAGPSSTPGDVVVSDTLPPGTTFVSATGAGWDCVESAGTVTCTDADGIAALTDAAPITLVVRVASDAGPSVILNHVSVDGPLVDPVPANNTDVDLVVVTDQADVGVQKAVVGSTTVDAGARVTYEITVSNAGPSDADTVVLTDVVPAGMSPLTASGPAGDGWTCTVAGATVTCHRPTFPAPAAGDPPTTSVITVVVFVATGVPPGTTLTNTATVSTATPGDDPADNTATATVTVRADADLRVTKSHGPDDDLLEAGTQMTYTVDVANLGPSDAAAPVTVVDTLPPGMTFVSSSGPWQCTGTTTVTCVLDGSGPLVALTSAPPLGLTVALDPDAPVGTLTNTADVSSPTPDPDTSNNTATDDVVVVRLADLDVRKTHEGRARIGDQVPFTITVSNLGPSSAANVGVVDTLPVGLTFVSASGTGWDCRGLLLVVSCTRSDPTELLAPGASEPDITVVVLVGPRAFSSVENVVTVSTTTPDGDRGAKEWVDDLDIPPQVDLEIVKTHDQPFLVGEDAVWTLTVTNHGPTDDPVPVVVRDVLPAGVTYVSASGDGVLCAANGQTVTCTRLGGLGLDETLTITLVVHVEAAAYPEVVNTATVSTLAEDTDPANDSSTDPAEIPPVSLLAIRKDLVSQVGADGTFQIVVTNTGPQATTTPVVVTDTVPEGLTVTGVESAPAVPGGPTWSCGTIGATVTCTYASTLAVGAQAPPILVHTDSSGVAPGTSVRNVATASGGQPPELCPECVPVTDDAVLAVPAAAAGGLSATGAAAVADLALLALALLVLGSALTVARQRWHRPDLR